MIASTDTGTVLHPDYGLQMAYSVDVLPDSPDGQVEHTIKLMRRYVLEDAPLPSVKEVVGSIRRAAEQRQEPLEDAIFAHVQRYLVFRNDDETVERVFNKWSEDRRQDSIEVLTRPVDTVELIRQGFFPREDCDGFSIYTAALLTAAGIPNAFATVGADGEFPDNYSHVYVVAYPQNGKYAGKRISFDTSHGKYLGWECPNRYGKFREWPVFGLFDLSGFLKLAAAAAIALFIHTRLKG